MTLRNPNEPTEAFQPLGKPIRTDAPAPSPAPVRQPQPGAIPVDMADIGMILRDGAKTVPVKCRTVADLHAQQAEDWLKLRSITDDGTLD